MVPVRCKPDLRCFLHLGAGGCSSSSDVSPLVVVPVSGDLPHFSGHAPMDLLSDILEGDRCPWCLALCLGREVRGLVVELTCPCLGCSSFASTHVDRSVTTLTKVSSIRLKSSCMDIGTSLSLDWCIVTGVASLLLLALLVLFGKGGLSHPF